METGVRGGVDSVGEGGVNLHVLETQPVFDPYTHAGSVLLEQ